MTTPPARQPIFNVPWVVVVLIAAMAGIEALRELLPDRLAADLLARYAFVPGRFTYAFDPARVLAPWSSLGLDDPAVRDSIAVARFFLGDGSWQPWTALTYALLHGGWTHLGLNAIWLLAFGTPVARRIGPMRFLLFMAASAVVGAAAHYAVDPASLQPLVGASASVSACMAAASRFMFQLPVPAGRLDRADAPPAGDRRPRASLFATLTERRALAFLAVWFVTNVVTGLAAVPIGLSDAPIAWQAHIGGFLMGLLAFPLFDRQASGGDGEKPPPAHPSQEVRAPDAGLCEPGYPRLPHPDSPQPGSPPPQSGPGWGRAGTSPGF